MRRSYTYKQSNITAPIVTFSIRSAAGLLPWTAEQAAEWCLTRDTNNLAAAEDRYAAACVALGQANRMKKPARYNYVAQAFRSINQARATLRSARKALAASQAAAAGLFPITSDESPRLAA